MDNETQIILISLIDDLNKIKSDICNLIEKTDKYLEKDINLKKDYNPDDYIEKEMILNASEKRRI